MAGRIRSRARIDSRLLAETLRDMQKSKLNGREMVDILRCIEWIATNRAMAMIAAEGTQDMPSSRSLLEQARIALELRRDYEDEAARSAARSTPQDQREDETEISRLVELLQAEQDGEAAAPEMVQERH